MYGVPRAKDKMLKFSHSSRYFLFVAVILYFTSIILLSIESVTYIGSIHKHIGINTKLVEIVSVIPISLLIYGAIKARKYNNRNIYILLTTSTVIFIGTAIIYIALLALEKITYNNFVYSHLHINLKAVVNLYSYSMLIFLISSLLYYFLSQRIRFFIKRHFNTLLIVILGLLEISILTEAFLVKGFVSKNLLVDPLSILSLLISSVVFAEASGVKIGSVLIKHMRVAGAVSVIALLIYLCFMFVETNNYNNYVYSKFHIDLNGLLYFSTSNSILYLSFINRELILRLVKTSRGKLSNENIKILKFIIVSSVFYYLISNLPQTINRLSENTTYIALNANQTYEDKVRYRWPFIYDYMMFVKNNTEENSVIAVPPMVRPWLTEGNADMVRYFLYPRKIVTGEINTFPKEADYLFLAKGSWPLDENSSYGWPKISITVKNIIYYHGEHGEQREVCCFYDSNSADNQNSWGLIKL